MHKELLGSSINKSAYIESQAKAGLIPKDYIFKILNFPDPMPLLEEAPLKLLEYIDFKMIGKPIVLIEPPITRSDLRPSSSGMEPTKWIVKGVKYFEEELRWESPLVACIGASRSRFPFEGALLQAYNILKSLLSTDLIHKTWIIMECPPDLYGGSSLDWAIHKVRDLLKTEPDIKIICPDGDSREAAIGIYLKVSDLNRFLSSMAGIGDPLYDMEIHEPEDRSLKIDLPIPLLEEG